MMHVHKWASSAVQAKTKCSRHTHRRTAVVVWPGRCSNIGHYPAPASVGPFTVEHMESHVMGDGAANPLFSVHLVEVGGNLAVSLTYSPVFHDRCVTAPLRRCQWARRHQRHSRRCQWAAHSRSLIG